MKATPVRPGFFICLALLLAAGLHVLVDLPLGPTRLRVGLSDLLLPLLLLPALNDFVRQRRLYVLRSPSIYPWLLLVSLWLLVALFIGHQRMGQWQSWALLNKVLGWGVLLGYFACGAWLAGRGDRIRRRFLQVWFLAGWLGGLYGVAQHLLWKHGLLEDIILGRAEGLYVNPNAFGIAMTALLVMQIPWYRARRLFPDWLHALGAAIAIAGILYSGSRSAALGLIVAAPLLLWWRLPGLRACLQIAIAAALVIGLGNAGPRALRDLADHALLAQRHMAADQGRAIRHPVRPQSLIMLRGGRLVDGGVSHRIVLTRRALAQWREHPLLGTGLGVFYWHELQAAEAMPALIHTSALWVMTEMGLVGLFLYGGLLVAVLLALWRARGNNASQPLHTGVLLLVVVLLGISLATETLYQRYLWLFLGLALRLDPGEGEETT